MGSDKSCFVGAKVVLFGQSGCIRTKEVVFRQNGLYFGKSGCVRASWLYSGKNWLHSGKIVVIGQKTYYSGKSRSIRAKSL